MGRSEKTVCGLVTAAGLSSRMGAFKPLLPLGDRTVIECTVDSLLAAGADTVVIVVGYRGEELEARLLGRYGDRVIIAWNRDYAQTDMLQSVQIGCRALPGCDGFFFLPGDMPLVRQDTVQRVLESWQTGRYDVVFPTRDGRRKHPPLISAQLIPEILAFSGEGGLRQLWTFHADSIGTVTVDDLGVELDLDTPEDYRACMEQIEREKS
jgi:CTP:molybdopterin cytidylyltransferase MocA